MSGSSNPVLERLARVHAQWLAFAAVAEARLLACRLTAQEQPALEALRGARDRRGSGRDRRCIRTLTARQAAYRAHREPLREHIERILGPDLPSAAAVETAAP